MAVIGNDCSRRIRSDKDPGERGQFVRPNRARRDFIAGSGGNIGNINQYARRVTYPAAGGGKHDQAVMIPRKDRIPGFITPGQAAARGRGRKTGGNAHLAPAAVLDNDSEIPVIALSGVVLVGGGRDGRP